MKHKWVTRRIKGLYMFGGRQPDEVWIECEECEEEMTLNNREDECESADLPDENP